MTVQQALEPLAHARLRAPRLGADVMPTLTNWIHEGMAFMKSRRLGFAAMMLSSYIAGVVDTQAQAARAVEPDVDSVRLELTTTCMVDTARPKTIASWDGLLRAKGMVKKEDLWELKTSGGTLRAFASFRPGETEYWFFLFPAVSLAVPDSVLSHLLAQSTYSDVQGDVLEIGLTTRPQSSPEVAVNKSITISLGGGRLLSSRTTINWKERTTQ